MVPDISRMRNSHGPEGGVGNFGPMDGCMEHHGARDAHDCLDGSLGMAVVMVSSGPSKPHDLAELPKVG